MNPTFIFIGVAILVLIIVVGLVFFTERKKNDTGLTPLAGLAFGFILAGLVFGSYRLVGYPLMGIGLALAVIDMLRRSRKG
jgi:amino acid transporter